MTLRKQLLRYGGLVTILFFAMFSAIMLLSNLQLSEMKKEKLADDVLLHMNDLLILSSEWDLYKYDRIRVQWDTKIQIIKEIISNSPELHDHLNNNIISLEKGFSDYQQVDVGLSNIEENDLQQRKKLLTKQDWLLSKMQIDSRTIVSEAVILADSASERVTKITQMTQRIAFLFMVLVFAVVAISTISFIRSIVSPLGTLLSQVNDLERGNFSSTNSLNVSRISKTQEIILISDAFNRMTKSLQQAFHKLELEIEKNKNINAELQQSNIRLSESESRSRIIIEQAGDAMYLSDLEGDILMVNNRACDMLGFSHDELLSKNVNDLDMNFVDRKITRDFMESLIPGKPQTLETTHRHKDGSEIPVEIRIGVFEDMGSKSVLGLVRDISERKQIENKIQRINEELDQKVIGRTHELEKKANLLNRSQKALTYLLEDVNDIRKQLEISNKKLVVSNNELEAFSYSVSHDLRAPLRGIHGFTQILMEDYADTMDDEFKRICSVIWENSQKMGHLIDDLLAFSRLSRTEMQKSTLDMKGMVNSIYYEVTDEDTREGISLFIDDIPAAFGDPALMKQVWINLISNAIKFSAKKERPIIRVTCTTKENFNIYCVSDNGAGFDMKYVNKLFGVFQRLHSMKEFDGTGVGLAIVQRIVLRHGGEVWAQGEVDKGAQLFFSLPVYTDNKI